MSLDENVDALIQTNLRTTFLNQSLISLIPGVYAHYSINSTLNNSELTEQQKVFEIVVSHIPKEIALNVARVGAVYALYNFYQFLQH